MNISLTSKQEARLQKLLETKQFKSVEEFIDTSLDAVSIDEAYVESEEFADLIREKLKESQKAIDEGRIYTFKKGELLEEIKRRAGKRLGKEQNV
jgi:Arc/MetJ-type ribon-helix-helix transcriptional regulator